MNIIRDFLWTHPPGLRRCHGFAFLICACVLAFVSVNLVASPSHSKDTTTEESSPALSNNQRDEIRRLIHDTLIKNPEWIIEVFDALESNRALERNANAVSVIKKNKDSIFSNDTAGSIGAADPTRTVVEFFDYNCGFCKTMLPVVDQLITRNDTVRVIFREFPILGPDSIAAARISLAVHAIVPEKYYEFHHQLMSLSGRKNDSSARKIAASIGVSEEDIDQKLKLSDIDEEITANLGLAEQLGIEGTPSFVINESVLDGVQSLKTLENNLQGEF